MSRAVMLSIRPKWCGLIASGRKTVEVRKTRPKILPPFRCYIYETQGKTDTPWMNEDGHMIFRGRGQVIGEFVCDKIQWHSLGPLLIKEDRERATQGSCIGADELYAYLGHKPGERSEFYAWNISGLMIYDEPICISEFVKPCMHEGDCGTCKRFNRKDFSCIAGIIRPPQSWCYVEEDT